MVPEACRMARDLDGQKITCLAQFLGRIKRKKLVFMLTFLVPVYFCVAVFSTYFTVSPICKILQAQCLQSVEAFVKSSKIW